jgi:hypothetical protein
MMIAGRKLFIAAALCVFSFSIRAETPAGEMARVPTVTRLVQIFSQLESEVITALKQKDQAKLSKLMDQNFQLQVALKSADFVPLSKWLNTSLAEAHSYSYNLSDMAVRDLDQVVMVSFAWKPYETSKKMAPSEVFVIDVWKKEGADWKLALRFASTAPKHDVRFPGFTFADGIIEKKY